MRVCQHQRWYALDAENVRFFRIGEWLPEGTLLGRSFSGDEPIHADTGGWVVEVQYDIWEESVFVVLDAA